MRVLDDQEQQPIWDDQKATCYGLSGRLFTAGSKIHLLDSAQQEELFFVKESFTSLLSTFTLYQKGERYAQVKQKLTLGRPRLTIDCATSRWEIAQNIWGMEFQLLRDGTPAAVITKGWEDWCKGIYTVEVFQLEDEPEVLALLIAIDRFIHGGGG